MRAIDSLIDRRIIEKTKTIQLLSKSMHSRLPSKYHTHCWLIDIAENLALIVVDSADVATALRYQQHELLKQINESSQNLVKIRRPLASRRVGMSLYSRFSRFSRFSQFPSAST